ncbi:hypothetical protein RRG08_008601 [Elysia crispata]|uniref:C-type lectin domain-containing protein n=1 Tax=Elysia crispata TaxID=231223 RepID=A0AAE1B8I1_9GAST|nr:hypothetical protein RRG08_008601 [Elysia crispata]
MQVSPSFAGAIFAFILLTMLFQNGRAITMTDMFDFVVEPMNFTNAELECQRRGFDGLAVISSPSEFNFAIDASKQLRKDSGLWVALRFDLNLQKLKWDDGTEVASNMPWLNSNPKPRASHACARVHFTGDLVMVPCHIRRHFICGNHIKTFMEARGITHKSLKPFKISSTLAEHRVDSYVKCVILCSTQHVCNTAWFDTSSLTCLLLRSDGYAGLQNNPNGQTFVMDGYSGYRK